MRMNIEMKGKILLWLFVVFVHMDTFSVAHAKSTTLENSVEAKQSDGKGFDAHKPGVVTLRDGVESSGLDLSQSQIDSNSSEQKVRIHVLGSVRQPGVYSVNLTSRVADIIKLAEPKRNTVRVVQIRSEGGKVRQYDLYQYFFFGDLKNNPFINDNDVIFVPESKGFVRIEGPLNNSGVFELYKEKSLLEITKLAGGFTSALSHSTPIKVIRFLNEGDKTIIDVDQDNGSLKSFLIKAGDVIIVPDKLNVGKKFDYSIETFPGESIVYPTSIPDVYVMGAVSSPGPYPYKPHFTIKDYLGFSGAGASANLQHVVILRNGKRVHKKISESIFAGDVLIVKERSLDYFVKYLGITSSVLSVTLSAIVLRDVLKND